ncbi:RNA polymerase subunit sigma-24 [Pseudoxanthomonas jiangsuensis]|uniref:RNA polymerase sigma factor n=1 Tax=Pseudoxanthomonas jiangsuensis TaxID=619688 RepID=UPI001391A79B|nr:RNA polymerase sigma factor [Pseudoxanthomonas jiangsuensis]KAF1699206.1 RNA polymerase subunit sigma-24 [Pseudoxanthomonas jiangsuensis]
MSTPQHDIHRTIDAVWRMESARVIAGLVRIVRDVGLAEELAQDALVAALEKWPDGGIPDNPGAWLMTTARNRAIDRLRHYRLREEKHVQLAWELEQWQEDAGRRGDELLDDSVGDDLLRLMFIACHPVLPPDSRVALTLRLLGGLETGEIARAFLASEATVAQRIVRAKRTLAEARVPFEIPRREELPERLAAVLGVVYLVFNEGYAATAGEDWTRPALCEEALRLGRVLAGLMPAEPDVHGLLALMELQASRLPARTGADGAPVLLLEQDRARWDRLLIGRGLESLAMAERLGGGEGPYALQAAIAACHARALTADATDWPRIAGLYATLARVAPSPVVELNRAVAVSMASGPAAALPLVEALATEPKLAGYHLLPSVRGDLLFRLERHGEARTEFERAAAMTANARERELLLARAAQCRDASGSPP